MRGWASRRRKSCQKLNGAKKKKKQESLEHGKQQFAACEFCPAAKLQPHIDPLL